MVYRVCRFKSLQDARERINPYDAYVLRKRVNLFKRRYFTNFNIWRVKRIIYEK